MKAAEARADEHALVFDRVSVGSGHPQRFGTQAKLVNGRVVFEPIDDSAHVDERRAQLGLPSLEVYKHLLDSLYTPRAKPR